MPDLQRFMDETVRDMRSRLALLADSGERRAIEDGIALLTDHRLSGLDEQRFTRLLVTLSTGRSPVGMVLKPQAIGRELAQRWNAYTGATAGTRGY
jgi:hypothetical protein